MSYVQSRRSPFQKVFAVLVGMAALAGTAHAGQDNGLYGWAKNADAAVDEVMVYPAFAARRGWSGRSVFTVTVDRNGDVIDSELVSNSGKRSLRTAARKVLARTEFPALPANYRGKELRFRLRLNYFIAGNQAHARALMRSARVRSEEVSHGMSTAGRITILSQAGAGH